MTRAVKQFVREVAVGVVVASIVAGGATLLVLNASAATQAQTNASTQKTSDDHESRLRALEATAARIDANVQWLVGFTKNKWSENR